MRMAWVSPLAVSPPCSLRFFFFFLRGTGHTPDCPMCASRTGPRDTWTVYGAGVSLPSQSILT